MNIIIPIHPRWVSEIMGGRKRYELRRVFPKRLDVHDHVFFYETAPTSKITGYAGVKSVQRVSVSEILNTPLDLRELYGMERHELAEMFEGVEEVTEIGLVGATRFDEPVPMARFGGKDFAPQSHVYTGAWPEEFE